MIPGTYILLLRLPRETTVQIGRLGSHRLETGYYAYTGSALSGLEGRIGRHLRSGKAKRWHIDHLREVATVQAVWVLQGPERRECSLAAELLRMPGAHPGPRGFGSSDCRCRTHLVHFADWPPMDRVEQRWGLRRMPV
jgi:Uri superfamily endonuclease